MTERSRPCRSRRGKQGCHGRRSGLTSGSRQAVHKKHSGRAAHSRTGEMVMFRTVPNPQSATVRGPGPAEARDLRHRSIRRRAPAARPARPGSGTCSPEALASTACGGRRAGEDRAVQPPADSEIDAQVALRLRARTGSGTPCGEASFGPGALDPKRPTPRPDTSLTRQASRCSSARCARRRTQQRPNRAGPSEARHARRETKGDRPSCWRTRRRYGRTSGGRGP